MIQDHVQREFLQLLDENAGIIHKVCRLYAHSDPDRQDLYQEILIQLWKSFPSFRGESKISTWMYRISLNTAISNLRKRQKSPAIVETDSFPAPIFDPNEPSSEERLSQLNEAMATLSEIEKALLILYLEEKSYEEMEEIMGISQGNLRVKMNRIKEKLRKIISRTETGFHQKK